MLIPPPDPIGLPVAPALLVALKVVGFYLHAILMTLWLAGMPAAVMLRASRPRVADRLFRVMPFALAFGINAGIVPLLFLQTLHPELFFPATILQAWFWLLVIPLVLVSYAAAYLSAAGRWPVAAGGMAAAFLAWVGVTFSAGMTLAASPERWPAVLAAQSDAAAVRGLYLHLDAPVLLRFGLMTGLALGTVAAFLALDAQGRGRDEAYRAEARPLVPAFALAGLALFGGCGLAYAGRVSGTLPSMWSVLAACGVPLATLAALAYGWKPGRGTAAALGVLHAAALLFNILARQIEQGAAMTLGHDPAAESVRGEWAGVILFLVAAVAGSFVLAWMGRVIARALRTPSNPPPAPP
jgi:hypothetical protein